jgi:hypothetical protein
MDLEKKLIEHPAFSESPFGLLSDDIDFNRVERRIIVNSIIEDLPNRIYLEKKGKELQEKYRNQVIKKILLHYKIEKDWLFFDSQSPWLMPDETKIFFRVNNVFANEWFVVIGDLDKVGNIVDWRVGLDI